jgi:uncharacterized membrane protein (DUF2068 family)
MVSSATRFDRQRARKNLLRAVATVEFVKGVSVLFLGVIAILLLHKDVWVIAESILALLHINTDRHAAQLFLDLADDLTDARLWMLARLAFFYSVLRFAEGYGLWNQRTWAEWLAFGSGMLLMPMEVRALTHGITALRCGALAVNLMIIAYMGFLLRAGRRERRRLRVAGLEPPEERGD